MAGPAIAAIIQWIVIAASVAYQVVQGKKMRKAAKDAEDARKGFSLVAEGDMKPIPIVYGRALIGGIRVWHAVSNSYVHVESNNADREWVTGLLTSTRLGNKNEYLYFQQVLCHGPINACYDMVVDESKWITDYALNSALKYEQSALDRAAFRTEVIFGGSDPATSKLVAKANDTVSANFPARANAKFPGIAYASTVIRLNRDDPQFYNVPPVQYLIEGRKVRVIVEHASDPGGGAQYYEDQPGVAGLWYTLSAARVYTNNPALCLLDYLLETELLHDNPEGTVRALDPGKRCFLYQINLQSFYRAARTCGKLVRYAQIPGYPAGETGVPAVGKIWRNTDGTREQLSRDLPLYECNIVLDPGKAIRENVETMLATMGDARLVWSQGRYKLSLKYPRLEKAPDSYPDPTDVGTPVGGGGGAGTDDTPPEHDPVYPGGSMTVHNFSGSWGAMARFRTDGTYEHRQKNSEFGSYDTLLGSGIWLSDCPITDVGDAYQVKFELIEGAPDPTGDWTWPLSWRLPAYSDTALLPGQWYTLTTDRDLALSLWSAGSDERITFSFNIYFKHVPSGIVSAPSILTFIMNYETGGGP